MGESWDPELVRQAGAVEGYEARFITQTAKYNRQILMLWGPQSDLARDPRWGRSEEVYGEDPFFNGTMVVAFIKGLQDGRKIRKGNTGKLRRCSSISSPTATRTTAPARLPISTSVCSGSTIPCRSAWVSSKAAPKE